MEVSVIGNSQVKIIGADVVNNREIIGFCHLKSNVLFNSRRKNIIGFSSHSKNCGNFSLHSTAAGGIRLSLNASASVNSSEIVAGVSSSPALKRLKSKSSDTLRLYVGLPLDSVSECNTVNHARAVAAGLKALKLLGVHGVELPIWWGAVEKETMGNYEWSAYLAVAEMVQKMDLKLHVSLCFHGSEELDILLPKWVSKIGESQPDIFFKDRSGKVYDRCLSPAVDTLPVLDGKSPTQVYQEFCESFKSSFAPFMGSTITGITMGLGPEGELRYPSQHSVAKAGVGEFQCYDANMLNLLKQDAEASGNPLWGLGGPHDVPTYDQPPTENTFFQDGGSWESPYGNYFLSWYSNQLITHGDRLLCLASSVFGDSPVTISGKLPLMHSWYKTNSHGSELTAGFYNTSKRDGYEAVAEMFARNSCRMILPGMDLLDQHLRDKSSPQSLLVQIKTACRKHGVDVSGQNISTADSASGFEQIKQHLSGGNEVVDLFTYQRMGASFFSPDHFPLFSSFVCNLRRAGVLSDDMPMEVEARESVQAGHLQAA